MIVDFHSHTCESDGTLTPPELCALMQRRGVTAFSITDHDTLGAYGKFEAPRGARVVTGIEINTTWDGGGVHVLGYRVPLGDSPMRSVLDTNRAARRTRIERMVEQLQSAGETITLADVHAQAMPGASLGRPHVAKALIALGIVPDVESAFRRYLVRGTPGYVPFTHITPFEAIDVIRKSGGIAVLAHPGRLRDDAVIDDLAQAGLQGLEVFYPTHEPMQVARFRATAKRLGLMMTAGMDFHDIRYHKRGVGMEVERGDVAPFLSAIA